MTNELFRHPKFIRLSDKAKLHLIELWAYCNEYQTDGIIYKPILEEKGKQVANQLRDVGWVDETNEKDAFYMHDYLDHQKSRDQLEELREHKRTAGSVGGKKSSHKRNHVNKDVFDPDCVYCVQER